MNTHRTLLYTTALAVFALSSTFIIATFCAYGAQEGIPKPSVPDGFGVNIHVTHFAPNGLQRFKDAGFGFVRMDVAWSAVEKTKGVYDFSAYDTLLSDLGSANARALLILGYANTLYGGLLQKGTSGLHTDAEQIAFASFAAAAAQHFAHRGVIWEIWNEPNGDFFWQPKANVEEYGAVVKVAAKAIRAADPGATILGGATNMLPQDYIEALLQGGALADVDALSVHPYRVGSPPESAALDYARIRALVARYTPSGKAPLPIVCSEWGYSTADISEQRQAEWMIREYLTNLLCGVNLTIFYDWKNDGPNPKYDEHRYGILKEDMSPKASYLEAQSFIQSLRGYTFCHRLASSAPEDYELLFEGPTDLALVDWSEAKNASDARHMPIITKVEAGEARYAVLKRAAGIQFTPDVRVAVTKPIVPATIRIYNPDSTKATVVVSNMRRAVRLTLLPHETKTAFTTLSVDSGTTGPIDLKIRWNGQPINIIAPLIAEQESLLDVQTTAQGADLAVTITNPLARAFLGKVYLRTIATGKQFARAITVVPGAAVTLTYPGASSEPAKLNAIDDAGLSWARQTTPAFVAVSGWSASSPPASTYQYVPYMNNSPLASSGVQIVPCEAGAPAASAIAVPYSTDPRWVYCTIAPIARYPIPANVVGLKLWVKGDNKDGTIHCRYYDSTFQTFQFKGVRINWTGWKQITIPLDGSDAIFWDGNDDGIIHPPLNLSALVLIDGSHLAKQDGQVLLAAPMYEVK